MKKYFGSAEKSKYLAIKNLEKHLQFAKKNSKKILTILLIIKLLYVFSADPTYILYRSYSVRFRGTEKRGKFSFF